ncbi:MAG: hypothetical protein ACM3SQ_02465 [Betaproteobacteria bacterium]
MRRNHDQRVITAILAGVAILGLSAWAYTDRDGPTAAVHPTYDKATGKLTELAYDSDHDGRPDIWTDMDGTRPLRTRIDRNGDGKIDRWEEYDRHGALVKVGYSTKDDGRPDAWVSPGENASIERVEMSSTHDEHRIDRWEYYDRSKAGPDGGGVLLRVEQDTIGDGKPHKWETYRDGALETVAFDEDGDGKPDRRLTYQGSVLTSIESHPDGSGRFTVKRELGR